MEADVENWEELEEAGFILLPHITWLTPKKETGWLNGKIAIVGLPQWAANNSGGYTESVSSMYYTNRGLPIPKWGGRKYRKP